MDARDFQRLALSLDGAEERSHMGAADFGIGGRIFATFASVRQGYGNRTLSPEVQAEFIRERPDVFLAISGGWGRRGTTHVRLAAADEDTLAGALRTAYQWRVAENAPRGSRRRGNDRRPGKRS